MITAVFTDNSDYARATGLWQWDYGQRLRIEGLHLPTAVEIHFALTEQSGDAITRVGTTKDGVTEVVIPESLLEHQAAGATYEIYAWIYLADKTSGKTIKRISMQVKCRPKPEGRDTPEDAELFREAIQAVNASADRAEAAREGAEAAQKAAEAAAGKIEGEIAGAGQIAEQVRQDADAVAKDKQAVSQMVTETTQNAQKAAEAAQAAESSSTAAKEAQTAAESAEAGATAAMEEVERDRTEVSETHRAVELLRGAVDTDRQAVAADRQAVENTALQFGQVAQSAINAVGQAQGAAVGAVSAEGQRQTTAVQQAGTQAVSEVGTAKAEAVQAVTTEGDTQTKRVQDAAAGIVADREQIAANKAGVESLQQNKADAIVETAQGETVTLTDSSDKLFRGLRVFGRSTQVKTTGAQLFDAETILASQISQGLLSIGKDGVVILNGTFNATNRNFKITLPVGTYTLSGDDNGIWHIIAPADGVFNQTLIVDVETTYNCYIFSGTYNNHVTTPMINAGDTALPWEPYSGGFPSPSVDWEQPILNAGESGSVEVEVTGRNLWDNEAAMSLDHWLGTNAYKHFDLNLKPNTTYTLSVNQNNMYKGYKSKYDGYFAFYLGETEGAASPNVLFGNSNSSIDLRKTYHTFTTSDKPFYINLYMGDFNEANLKIAFTELLQNIMFAEGASVLPYEPYHVHQSLTLATPNGLPGVPVSKDGNYTDQNGQQWVCDEVDLGRGKYVQRVGKYVFDGTELINDSWLPTIVISMRSDGLAGLRIDGGLLSNYGNVTFSNNTGKTFSFNSAKWGASNGSELKELLKTKSDSGSPVIVQYVLATPIERDLTPEEIAAYSSLHTNYPTTVITNDAGAHMEASYVADTGTYIRNMEERLNAKLVNIQSALISQKISGGV